MGNRLRFYGTIQTDGVSLTVMKQNMPTNAGESRTKKSLKEKEEYIHQQSPEYLQKSIGNCVLIDPGRRELLSCLHESSTPTSRKTWTYTIRQRDRERRLSHYRNLLLRLETPAVKEAREQLSLLRPDTCSLGRFLDFLRDRVGPSRVLSNHYEDDLFRRLRLSRYIRKQQAHARMVATLREKFGRQAIHVWGEWSARIDVSMSLSLAEACGDSSAKMASTSS